MIRRPDLAGQWYPADKGSALEELKTYTATDQPKRRCIGAIVPHAGWQFSGRPAGLLLAQTEIPPTVVLLGPNHRGPFTPFALSSADAWRTPIADVEVDKPLQAEITARTALLEYDDDAHANENSLELIVPFLPFLRPGVRIVPILIGAHRYDQLEQLGTALAQAIAGKDALIIASSDMTHFADADTARRQDAMAIREIEKLDPVALHRTVIDNNISMCGMVAAVAMLVAARQLGASAAEVLCYTNSGEVTGDTSSVVAYAAIQVF